MLHQKQLALVQPTPIGATLRSDPGVRRQDSVYRCWFVLRHTYSEIETCTVEDLITDYFLERSSAIITGQSYQLGLYRTIALKLLMPLSDLLILPLLLG